MSCLTGASCWFENTNNSDTFPFLDDFDFSDEMMDRVAQTAQEEIGPMPIQIGIPTQSFSRVCTRTSGSQIEYKFIVVISRLYM